MNRSLKILMLEDSAIDAEIIQQALLKKGPNCIFKVVMTEEDYLAALESFRPEVILSDNTLPQFDATRALELFKQRSLSIPFILVTGTVSEEFAVDIIKSGADDYILKDRLTRLHAAIYAALQKKRTEASAKQSEEVRKLIMNAALDAIICVDTSGLITVWNRQAEKLFGWQEAEAMGKPMADIIIPIERRDKHKADFSNYLKNGEGLVLNKAIELTALTKTGEEFPIEIAVVHVKQDSADFFCAFVRDIRERKRFEENLKKMEMRIVEQKIQEQKKLARAMIKAQEEEKNRIGQELHDNINQILAGTKIFLSIAAKKDKVVSDLVKYPMELIDNSIEEIRSLSRKQVTPLKNIDLEELVQELISSLDENSMPEVKFNYEVPADLLPDDLKLSIYRILQEQMNNILKHAAAKHVLISIRAGSEAIELVVEDDGIGFNVNIRRKGIGISNMINRVDTFNGTVDINSEPGKGCKITVKIPF